MNKNKHLTLDERRQIELLLSERLSFKAIGERLGRDCTTISKEVRGHYVFEKSGSYFNSFNDCVHNKKCSHKGDVCKICNNTAWHNRCSVCGKCMTSCKDYEKKQCFSYLKPPYVCNGCVERRKCRLEKRFYRGIAAQKKYEVVRSESRSGFNLTESERKRLDSIISPLLKNGQSLHHILVNNADSIPCCEKTAYVYADNGLFSAKNIDMPRKVRFRPRKKKSVSLKVDKACRIGRTYEDFKLYCESNPSVPITELDTVEGLRGGAVLLTIHFVRPKLQLAFLREANDSQSVIDIFDRLYVLLGDENYRKIFSLCLADNGSEFSNPTAIETDYNGGIKTKMFYCNPSSPGQKGSCENNHEFIRRIIPKGVDLSKYSQKQIDLMMDHINSYSRPELGDKTPYEAFCFYYGKEILSRLGVRKIPSNEVILKPSLLK